METQFILTADNTLIAATDAGEAVPGSVFSSGIELGRLLRDWQMRLLVELWNRLPGVRPVTKFENRILPSRDCGGRCSQGASPRKITRKYAHAEIQSPPPSPGAKR